VTASAQSPSSTVGAALPDLRPLAWGRIALGILFLLRTTPLLIPVRLPFATGTVPLLGWPSAAWHGAAIGVVLPSSVLRIACIVRTVSALGFTLGVWTRACGIAAGLTGYLVMFQSPFGFVATLHLLFQGAIVLALTDAGSELALVPARPLAPRSSLWLVRVFLASIYFWAGVAKLNADWLSGRTFLLFRADGLLSGPFSDFVLASGLGRRVVAHIIATTELLLPALFFWGKTRRIAPWIALGMHAAIELAARPDLLGWEMAALLLCLWPTDRRADLRASALAEPTAAEDTQRSGPATR
jgi:hypothetical protein